MPKRGSVFKTVNELSSARNAFNLSHEKKFTCDFGQLIPCCFLEANPGDIFKIRASILARFQPLVHPIMHEVSLDTHYFFVPTRLIFGNDAVLDSEDKMEQPNRWERFIGRGKSGNDQTQLPPWEYWNYLNNNPSLKYSLWDYFGLPISFNDNHNSSFLPIDFAKRCYNFVWEEYYRDENLQETWAAKYKTAPDAEHPEGLGYIGEGVGDAYKLNENILNRNWTKDYFTSARPWQQKGTSPSFHVVGDIDINFVNAILPRIPVYSNQPIAAPPSGATQWNSSYLRIGAGETFNTLPIAANEGIVQQDIFSGQSIGTVNRYTPGSGTPNFGNTVLSTNTMDITQMLNDAHHLDNNLQLNADINDIRTSVQIQKWLERNARGGTRYTEFLRSHHGVSPSDSRLDRPEYIGGSKQPIIVSEVLQTSESGSVSAQGNMAGHGISADVTKIGNYRVEEYGYIIGLMSVMPKPAYQDGIHRTFLRRSPFDFYFREFANLSEREIVSAEIAFNGNDETDEKVFGFQGQYDELRVMEDMVCADMRDDFNTWHLGRKFDEYNPPELNENFIACDSQTGGATNQLKRIFALPSERGIIVNFANIITALRQMPVNPEPGLMDHF